MVSVFEGDAARLQAEVSLVRLVEASGVRLEKRGPEHVGRCPFHEDDAQSLVITPTTNLWRCVGPCNVGGDVIDWVAKRNGVSHHHAVQLLCDGSPEAPQPPAPVKQSTVRRLRSPVKLEADAQALLSQVVGYYHETLKQNPEALAFLRSRGLVHNELVERFRLGCANRTLGLRLPEKNRKAGAEIRSRLEAIGLYREPPPRKGFETISPTVIPASPSSATPAQAATTPRTTPTITSGG
jgi:DNA primase